MNRRVAAAMVVAALVATACGRDDLAEAPSLVTTTAAPDRASTSTDSPPTSGDVDVEVPAVEIVQINCPADLIRADGPQLACGVATVPIDRADGSLGTTRITVATLAGYDAGFSTPLAVLQGGPGGASSGLGAWFPQQAFTQVFVDQRGAGFAGPDFDCPEIIDSMGRILGSDSVEGGIVADAAYDDCARRLDDDLVLRHTDTTAHAEDVADVMAALGYDRWAVYGVSYGSTIALEILRAMPAGVAGVVLDGVYPPELDTDAALVQSAERAVDEIDAACAAESICRNYLAGGSFRSTLERVMSELDAEPMTASVTGNEIGYSAGIDVVLDGRRVAELSFLLMYHESLLRFLPAVIGGLDDRDPASARWLASTGARLLVSSQNANDEGTYFAVQCHDRLPFTAGPGTDLPPFGASIAAAGLEDICDEWEREPAGEEADDPVIGSLPVLLLSGSFDPITPPDFAVSVASRLPQATTVEQRGRGHGIWFGSDCIAQIVQLFVADPARTLDTACAEEPVPVEWARP